MEKMITTLAAEYVPTGDPEKGFVKLKVEAMPENWREFYQKYILQFGKFKGTKVTDMNSQEQISWLLWYYKNCYRNPKTDVTYRVVKWYLGRRKLIKKKVKKFEIV